MITGNCFGDRYQDRHIFIGKANLIRPLGHLASHIITDIYDMSLYACSWDLNTAQHDSARFRSSALQPLLVFAECNSMNLIQFPGLTRQVFQAAQDL